jgi:hypothetical protein
MREHGVGSRVNFRIQRERDLEAKSGESKLLFSVGFYMGFILRIDNGVLNQEL